MLVFIPTVLILDGSAFFLDIKGFLNICLTLEYRNIYFGLLVCLNDLHIWSQSPQVLPGLSCVLSGSTLLCSSLSKAELFSKVYCVPGSCFHTSRFRVFRNVPGHWQQPSIFSLVLMSYISLQNRATACKLPHGKCLIPEFHLKMVWEGLLVAGQDFFQERLKMLPVQVIVFQYPGILLDTA